jgi:hypothetical protein
MIGGRRVLCRRWAGGDDDVEGRMVGRVGQSAEGRGDGGRLAVAGDVCLDERRTVGDGYLDDGDLLDLSALG